MHAGGRLRHAHELDVGCKHPIVLESQSHITKLIIKDFDNALMHCGAGRVIAEVRRKFWILCGRQAICG